MPGLLPALAVAAACTRDASPSPPAASPGGPGPLSSAAQVPSAGADRPLAQPWGAPSRDLVSAPLPAGPGPSVPSSPEAQAAEAGSPLCTRTPARGCPCAVSVPHAVLSWPGARVLAGSVRCPPARLTPVCSHRGARGRAGVSSGCTFSPEEEHFPSRKFWLLRERPQPCRSGAPSAPFRRLVRAGRRGRLPSAAPGFGSRLPRRVTLLCQVSRDSGSSTLVFAPRRLPALAGMSAGACLILSSLGLVGCRLSSRLQRGRTVAVSHFLFLP